MVKKPMNIAMGERIRAQRERRGWKREYLAEVTGFSVRYLAMLETGVTGVSLEGLKTFSEKLGVSADYLLNGYKDIHFKNITAKLSKLQELNPEHIENIEIIIDTYMSGVSK